MMVRSRETSAVPFEIGEDAVTPLATKLAYALSEEVLVVHLGHRMCEIWRCIIRAPRDRRQTSPPPDPGRNGRSRASVPTDPRRSDRSTAGRTGDRSPPARRRDADGVWRVGERPKCRGGLASE